ncbi:hypothetical protein HA051_08300 [Chromobacterium vaccinii]|nr:hypothetical protein [Chromobacterium vaccinii]
MKRDQDLEQLRDVLQDLRRGADELSDRALLLITSMDAVQRMLNTVEMTLLEREDEVRVEKEKERPDPCLNALIYVLEGADAGRLGRPCKIETIKGREYLLLRPTEMFREWMLRKGDGQLVSNQPQAFRKWLFVKQLLVEDFSVERTIQGKRVGHLEAILLDKARQLVSAKTKAPSPAY